MIIKPKDSTHRKVVKKKVSPKKAKPAKKAAPKKEAPKKAKPAKKVAPKKSAPKKVEPKKAAPKKAAPKKEASDQTRVYHVSKREDGKWQVKFAGGEKAIKLFKTQAEALEYSKTMTKNQNGAMLVHNSKGKNKGRIKSK